MFDKSVTLFGTSPFLQIQEINFFKTKNKEGRFLLSTLKQSRTVQIMR